MDDLRIEREVVIEAPVDVVWRTITDPEQITRWFADRVELEAKPGGRGTLTFHDPSGAVVQSSPIVVETVEPPTRFSFRWMHAEGEEPAPANSILVEFTLAAQASERTLLRVVESGLDLLGWPDGDKQNYAKDHRSGWSSFLDRLAAVSAN